MAEYDRIQKKQESRTVVYNGGGNKQLKEIVDNRRPGEKTFQDKGTVQRNKYLNTALLMSTAAFIAYYYWKSRRAALLDVNLQLRGAKHENDRLYANVRGEASGLQPTDWVDYQIKWAKGAVPGGQHLNQRVGVAGGWRSDQPNRNVAIRHPGNLCYYNMDRGDNWKGPNWEYNDGIEQSDAILSGRPNDQQWWFRAVVKNAWGVPLKTSNEVNIKWAECK